MAKPKGGLGKGLDALIPSLTPALENVDLELISPNPYQPRTSLDPVALEELADSIREHGMLQPLIVTQLSSKAPGEPVRYQLIAGERRWQAARLAGLNQVPVLIKEATPSEALQLALVENLQRSDLNPLEEAQAYHQLIAEFGLTQEDVARRVGKQRSTVANALRLLGLSGEVKKSLACGEITEGHARALLGLPDEAARQYLWQRILERGWNVRQVEEAVRRWSQGKGLATRSRAGEDPQTRHLEDRFRATLGTKVSLKRGRKGGQIVIYFYNDEELQGIYRAIVGQE